MRGRVNDVFNYNRLSYTMDSVLRDNSKYNQRDKPWIIQNLLPTEFKLYYSPAFSGESIFLDTIRPRATRVYHPNKFTDGDKLYVMYSQRSDSKEHMMMLPHTIQRQWKRIKIGDVLYRSSDGGRQNFTSNADISGLMIHNNLLFPINIYYKGNMIGQVSGYDGITYLGGSSSSLFIDNDREGFRLGDQITFSYSMEDNEDKLFTITLKDNHAYHVHVGKIGVGEPENVPDTYAHSVDFPPQTGITYYVPIGRYDTVPTNINAPI